MTETAGASKVSSVLNLLALGNFVVGMGAFVVIGIITPMADGLNVSQADTVQLWTGSQFLTYYFNGAHWKAAGSTGIQDNAAIQRGSAFFAKRKSTAAGLEAFLSQQPPY